MLSPYRVLDLTDEGALLCGQILGDLGADVIVIEPPDGAHTRTKGPFYGESTDPDKCLSWWAVNRNKRGITLDLESAADRQRFLELAATTDFLIESKPPGYLDGLGLGYEALSKLNPRLVMVSITPFGQSGPEGELGGQRPHLHGGVRHPPPERRPRSRARRRRRTPGLPARRRGSGRRRLDRAHRPRARRPRPARRRVRADGGHDGHAGDGPVRRLGRQRHRAPRRRRELRRHPAPLHLSRRRTASFP